MKARLLCKFGEMKGSEFEIDAEATIGRGESNSIVLEARSVSSEHARLFRDENGRYVLEDLESRNGTELDGKTLRGMQALDGLHVINFGKSADFLFVSFEPSAVTEPPTVPEAPEAVPASDDAPGRSVTSTVVDVEPLPLPSSLAPRKTSAPGKTIIERASPELPDALRGEPDGEEGPRGGA